MVSNDGADAPPRRISKSSSRANSTSVGPSARRWRTRASASSAIRAASAMRSTSPASLTLRSSSTSPSVATSSASGNHSASYLRCAAQVTAAASRPSRAIPAASSWRNSFWLPAVSPIRMRASTPACAELERRLVAVAAVGDEDQVVGPDEQQGGRPGEPGEVPDVDHPGDEQGVALGLGEGLTQAGDARRPRPSVFMRATVPRPRTARRYPWPPKPEMIPVATGVTTEVCRHSSRAAVFDRWSSTTGPSKAASASRSDQE